MSGSVVLSCLLGLNHSRKKKYFWFQNVIFNLGVLETLGGTSPKKQRLHMK